jgi:hypothetical protein
MKGCVDKYDILGIWLIQKFEDISHCYKWIVEYWSIMAW